MRAREPARDIGRVRPGPRSRMPSPALRRWAAALSALAAIVPGLAPAAELEAAVQQQIRAATFEVVQLKPADGEITYDRPLPLDLIPYRQRSDKYRSIGTAFAIAPNRFITAGHVIALGLGSQFGPPALRDSVGRVYAIEQVLKYSDQEDFAVFSLREPPKDARSLQPGAKPALNQAVFAAGNALGEGVVIRDGVYTSDTPEDLDGKWKWLRFSAAASPGNSGGPLVDQAGKVIGVVLRTSPSENLNFALSIDQVLAAKDDEGRLSGRTSLRTPIIDAAETIAVDERFPLPKTLPDFYATVARISQDAIEQGMARLMEHNAARLFPHGAGSQQLLHAVLRSPFPKVVHESQDGNWIASSAAIQTYQLEHNGFVTLNGGALLLRTPDDVSLSALYGDSKLFMDMVLKGLSLRRAVGSESVKVTSLGKARDQGSYTDGYGRLWRTFVWPIPYDDAMLTLLCLPTPQGYVAIYARTPSGYVDLIRKQQQRMADYILVTMEGTLPQWRDYLRQKGMQPQIFGTLKLDVDSDRRLLLESPRFKFEVTPELVRLGKESVLSLDFAFFASGGAVVWDIGSVAVSESANKDNSVAATRMSAPPSSLPDQFQSEWNKLEAHEFPYNATVFSAYRETRIETGVQAAGSGAEAAVRYVLSVTGEGEQPQDVMDRKLDLLQRSFEVLEQ